MTLFLLYAFLFHWPKLSDFWPPQEKERGGTIRPGPPPLLVGQCARPHPDFMVGDSLGKHNLNLSSVTCSDSKGMLNH